MAAHVLWMSAIIAVIVIGSQSSVELVLRVFIVTECICQIGAIIYSNHIYLGVIILNWYYYLKDLIYPSQKVFIKKNSEDHLKLQKMLDKIHC